MDPNPLGKMTFSEYVTYLRREGFPWTTAENFAARVYRNWGPGYIYCYRDFAGEILYVGSAKDFRSRHAKHRQKSPWFTLARHYRWIKIDDLQPLRALEGLAQYRLQPRFIDRYGIKREWIGDEAMWYPYSDGYMGTEVTLNDVWSFWESRQGTDEGLDWLGGRR